MTGRFAWVRHLPSEALEEFVEELVDQFLLDGPVEVLLASWQTTAEVYSDVQLHKALTEPEEHSDQ